MLHDRTQADVESLILAKRDLEAQLSQFEQRLSLTQAEQAERSRLKKEKLRIKDKLAALGLV